MKQPETSDDPDDYAEEATTFTIPTAEELFDAYDDDGSGGLYLNEFRDILEDLDGLDGVPEKEKNEYIAQEFESADLNHDGMLNIDEFMLYYYGELCFKFPVGKNGHNPGAILYNIFVNYCSFGKGGKRSEEMESHQFLRLCQDCQLLNGRTFTKAGADLVFHFARAERVYRKQLGACKLQYDQFLHALLLVGERRKSGFEEVAARVLQHAGPKKFATMADFLVFTDLGNYEDDRSLERPKGLPQLKHRGVNDVLQKMKRTASAVAGGDGPGANLNQSSATGRMPPASAGLGGSQGEADLRSSIKTALFRQPPPAHSRSQELIGTGAVAADAEPRLVPDPEPSASPDTSQVMPGAKTARTKWHFDKVGAEVEEELTETFKKTGTAALQDSRVRHSLRTRSEDELTMALKRVFERYNKWEKGTNRAKMDRMRFHKVLRDAQLVKDADLPAGKVDTIFSQIRPTSEVQINFVQFMYGLRHVASEKRLSLNEVIECIVAVNAPISVVK